MHRLADLEAFVAIVEARGQTAAARRLRRSLQSINRSLTALERSLGVELVHRTTRQSRPTAAGLAFYRRIKPALIQIDDARTEVSDQRGKPSGSLRISAPIAFAAAHVVPAIGEFLERYPAVEIELQTSDRAVDVVGEGLDLAVRIRDLPESSLKVRRLGELRVVVFGTTDYLRQHGWPRHPDELLQHQCVMRVGESPIDEWPFRIDGRLRRIRVAGRFKTDSAAAMQAAVVQGIGLGRTPLWQIRALLDAGIVAIVLEDFEIERLPIYAVLPPARYTATRTRLFVDVLTTRLKRERW